MIFSTNAGDFMCQFLFALKYNLFLCLYWSVVKQFITTISLGLNWSNNGFNDSQTLSLKQTPTMAKIQSKNV